MKILMFTCEFAPYLGGVAVATHRLARGLVAAGHEVVILSARKGPEFDSSESESIVRVEHDVVDGLPVYRFHRRFHRPEQYAQGIHLLRDLVEDIRPDIVHSYFVKFCGYQGHVCARWANAPHIVSCRGNDITKYLLQSTDQIRLVLNSADYVLSVSRSLLRWGEIVSSLPRKAYVPNSVGPEFLSAANVPRDEARKKWQRDASMPAVGTVFRPSWKKGADYLHQLLRRLGGSHLPGLSLVLIGRYHEQSIEPFRKSFLQNAPEGAERTIHVMSSVSREDLPGLLRSLDLTLITSRREGMPNVALESLSCGTPVAGTAVDGVVDILQGERAGLLLDRFDADRAATEIIALLQDEPRLQGLRHRGPELIAEKYTLSHEVEAHLNVYQTALQNYDAKTTPGWADFDGRVA